MNSTGPNRHGLAIAPVTPSLAPQNRTFDSDDIFGTSFHLHAFGTTDLQVKVAVEAALAEVQRLRPIFDPDDPNSEVNRIDIRNTEERSADLNQVLAAYNFWEHETAGTIRAEIDGRVQLDALSLAYAVDRAAEAARSAAPEAGSMVVALGNNVRIFGEGTLDIADPTSTGIKAAPLTRLRLSDGAVVTSHRDATEQPLDPWTGRPEQHVLTASVVARNCVTAAAISHALCQLSPKAGLHLISTTRRAEGLLVTAQGAVLRSNGFRAVELPRLRPALAS